MEQYTAALSDIGARDLTLVGGKAARLGELAGIGISVPSGFVVLTIAYQEFVKRNDLGPRIEKVLADATLGDVKRLWDASARVRELFTSEEMPSDIASEIAARYQDLGQPAAAVRSSATAEDMPGASFAGQYDTYLNVHGSEQIMTRVISCWASLWNAGAISYRLANGIPQGEGELSMACIVEEMVDAEKSGVLFTVNPLNNSDDQVVINSCFGLGEAVVSGEYACDHVVVDKRSKRTIAETIGNKEHKIVPDEKGGCDTIMVPLSEQERATPCLRAEELVELVEVSETIESFFGYPQDIEWAFREGKLHILQSRDITTLGQAEVPEDASAGWVSEFDTRIDPKYSYYATANVKEVCPGPLTPLTISDLIKGMDDAFGQVNARFRLMKGIDPDTEFAFLGLFYNHVFLNISVFSDITSKLPAFGAEELTRTYPADAEELWQKKFHPTAEALVGLVLTGGSMAVDAVRKLRESRSFTLECARRFPMDTSVLERQDSGYVLYWIDQAGRLRDRMSVTHIALTQFAIATYHLLGMVAQRWFGADKAVAPKVVSSIGELTGAMPMIDIWDLSRMVLADPTLKEIFESTSADKVRAALRESSSEKSGEFLDSLDRFMKQFGHRSVFEVEAMSPSWSEDPTFIFSMIRNYLAAEDSQSPKAIWLRQERERKATMDACLSELGPIRGALFKALIKVVQRYIERREHMKGLLVEAISEMKKGFRVLSRRFVAEGIIEDASDFYFLTLPEIRRLVSGSYLDIPVKEVVIRRRSEYRRNALVVLPEVSRGKPIPLATVEAASVDALEVLEGIAVSPGTYTGRARVITDLRSDVVIEMGEVLVAPLTDAAWTPLFVPAGAIVVDLGGPLSHGSIVAREYGIPGVINVGVGTRVIKDGQIVTVDGTNGKVYLVRDSEEHVGNEEQALEEDGEAL